MIELGYVLHLFAVLCLHFQKITNLISSIPFMLSWLSTFSCLFAALCLSSAAPVESKDELFSLNERDFRTSTSRGLWFIEFFSPHCVHCKRFRPTWEQMVSDKASYRAFGFNMAQVDCIANGDLCHAMDVEYYPQLSLYRDGELVEVYKADTAAEELSAYIDRQVQEFSRRNIKNVGTPIRVPNELGNVSRLDSQSFDAAISEGPLFVKMFAPWCGHCNKLAPVWDQLASHMKGVITIAEVNCDDNASLCNREDVEGYPTLFLYQNGKKVTYRDSRSLTDLESWIVRAVTTARGLTRLELDALEDAVKKEPVVFAYFKSPVSSEKEYSIVLEAARSQLGGPPVYLVESPQAFRRFSIDAGKGSHLFLFRDFISRPADRLDLTALIIPDALQLWMTNRRFPSAFELTSGNFQDVMRADTVQHVLLVAVHRSQGPATEQLLLELSNTWKTQSHSHPTFFVWMDVDRWDSWLRRMYGFQQDKTPLVVITNHKQLIYYDVNGSNQPLELQNDKLVRALNEVFSGKLLAKHSENVFERLLRSTQESLTPLITLRTFLVAISSSCILFIIYVYLRRGVVRPVLKYRKDKGNSRLD
ncbi:thioredoxin-like protein [Cantharellus anzutake]|uniref:thioredoxin-like protein n=1 Tax=Cantharellus anzutake TaxID=1750568 RepID=UPI001903BEDA|nr:thioredoxin-like protein [Cantharellus anzutake]KAF8334999.1 thioredoxin-like protein [Cantharellus anzutake]